MVIPMSCVEKAFVRCWIVLLLFVLPHLTYPQNLPRFCFSSCGKILNITYPFRLKGDPDGCGDKRYELDCVKNVTILRLYSGEFYVQSINSNNYTIRLVDTNIQPNNCSSLPPYFLYKYNFTDRYHYWDFLNNINLDAYPYQFSDYYSERYLFRHIIYLDCRNPPGDDAYYVDTASCIDKHIYAVVGDLEIGRWKPQCHVKLVTLTSFWGVTSWGDSDHVGNVSYIDIHKALQYGFELSWLQISGRCRPGFGILVNNTATSVTEVECLPEGDGESSAELCHHTTYFSLAHYI
ncbi:hypothetical protein VNO77_30735 [Canavalia gladiata]|uniref:Wall-associated receptor kinase galacturonan-binding domain-containing protein n=1 Tax=Canavalia gladiata TaxID=3824 RepID=A0AAN9KRT8_CANGL